MVSFRGHLRRCAGAWLVVQFVSVGALLGRDCCLVHGAGAAGATATHCEQRLPAERACHMRAGDGTPCAMHAGAPLRKPCTLRGTCDGPTEGLALLLSPAGIVPAPISAAAQPTPITSASLRSEPVIELPARPDPLPPRA